MKQLDTPRGYRLNSRVRKIANRLLDRWMERSALNHLRSKTDFPVELFFKRELECDSSPRWTSKESHRDLISIVIVTYRQPDALRCLLNSLVCQTLQNFRVLIVHDGPDEATEEVVKVCRQAKPDTFEYQATTERFNDYGHSLRAMVIPDLQTDFVLITNGDNYYSPRLIEMASEMLIGMNLDIVLWDMVHSHPNAGITRSSSYQPFTVYPIRNFVDVGAFIVRTELAKRAGFRDLSHDGDATYFEDIVSLAKRPLRIGKIYKTLMMHN